MRTQMSDDDCKRYQNPTLTTREAVTILRLLRKRRDDLAYVAGPGEFGGEEHGWLNEDKHKEHDALLPLIDKIARAILG